MYMKVEAGKNRLDDLISAQGLTYEQVAERAGYSTVFVWQMAKGKRNIALKHLDRLAAAIGCAPGDILGTGIGVDNAQLLNIWAAIPADRRDLALQVLNSLTDHASNPIDQDQTSTINKSGVAKKKK